MSWTVVRFLPHRRENHAIKAIDDGADADGAPASDPDRRDSPLARLVDSRAFNLAIAGAILLNAVVLGLGTYPDLSASTVTLLASLNAILFGVFLIELIMRILSYGRRPWEFFKDPWNVFDAVIIGAVLIPGIREQATILRLLRLARIVRIVRFLPEARILIMTVSRAIPSVLSMFVLTTVILFLYAMVGWSLFGEALPSEWGTVGQSMLTLFVLLTLENFPTYLESAQAVSPYATAFFISYVLVAAFVVVNLFIGVVVGAMDKVRAEEEESLRRAPDPAQLALAIEELSKSLERYAAAHARATPDEVEPGQPVDMTRALVSQGA